MAKELEAWNFFEDILPPEIAELVFSFLSLEDTVYVTLVCKSWNAYFEAKEMWKKMSEHFFGALSPKNVDLTQNFEWKPLFISLRKGHRWSKTFPSTQLTYEVPQKQFKAVGPIELGPSGQYIHTRTFSVDVKMAGKIVHMRRDPVIPQDREWQFPRVRYPNTFEFIESQYKLLASNGKGKFLVEADKKWSLYDCEHMATQSPAEHHVTQCGTVLKVNDKSRPWEEFPSYIGSFNSRFAVVADTRRYYQQQSVKHEIFDFQSTCSHVMPCFKDQSKDIVWQRNYADEIKDENHPLRYRKLYSIWLEKVQRCKDHTINTSFGVLGVFASQLVPEKIVFMLREPDEKKSTDHYVCYPKLAIWTAGEGLNETNCVKFKNEKEVLATNFSEHVIDEYHWLCFNMDQYTRIIDLNNFAHQFKLDLVQKRMWIPKKNKIVLVSGKKITVFDLQMNRWTSRMVCPNDVRAMTFNKSEKLLFVADWQFVHAFHWETARLIGSTFHPLAQTQQVPVESLHVAYDQVIILNGSIFMKMPTKCDV